MRLIDADTLRDRLKEIAYDRFNLSDEYGWFLKGLIAAEESVDEAPTIDPVRYGRWLWDDERMSYYCTECLYHAVNHTLEVYDGTFEHCPGCGAKMRGFDDEDYD